MGKPLHCTSHAAVAQREIQVPQVAGAPEGHDELQREEETEEREGQPGPAEEVDDLAQVAAVLVKEAAHLRLALLREVGLVSQGPDLLAEQDLQLNHGDVRGAEGEHGKDDGQQRPDVLRVVYGGQLDGQERDLQARGDALHELVQDVAHRDVEHADEHVAQDEGPLALHPGVVRELPLDLADVGHGPGLAVLHDRLRDRVHARLLRDELEVLDPVHPRAQHVEVLGALDVAVRSLHAPRPVGHEHVHQPHEGRAPHEHGEQAQGHDAEELAEHGVAEVLHPEAVRQAVGLHASAHAADPGGRDDGVGHSAQVVHEGVEEAEGKPGAEAELLRERAEVRDLLDEGDAGALHDQDLVVEVEDAADKGDGQPEVGGRGVGAVFVAQGEADADAHQEDVEEQDEEHAAPKYVHASVNGLNPRDEEPRTWLLGARPLEDGPVEFGPEVMVGQVPAAHFHVVGSLLWISLCTAAQLPGLEGVFEDHEEGL
mmetsp:Transcript_21346/g.66155  ORF Transcript_21346/g.66155 Transcript_21346/m.66155 type:complete len:485 (-) Transcript_21346:1012-2466(-)